MQFLNYGVGILGNLRACFSMHKVYKEEYAAVEINQHEPLIAIGFLVPFLIIYAIFSWI